MQSTDEPCRHGETHPGASGETPIVGSTHWVDPHGTEAVWRLDDERRIFASPAAAARALDAENGRIHVTALPPLEIAAAFSANRRAFGGTVILPSGEPWTAYLFLARVDRVLVSVFVIQGPRAAAGALKRDAVEALATRAVRRVELVPP